MKFSERYKDKLASLAVVQRRIDEGQLRPEAYEYFLQMFGFKDGLPNFTDKELAALDAAEEP